MKYISILILTIVTAGIDSAIQFQRPCEDLSEECLTKTFQMALPNLIEERPELGLQSLDPYFIDKLDMVLPGGLSIQFSQGIARGMRNCHVDFARLIGDTLETQLHCNLAIKGKYRSLGRLLAFRIDGQGDCLIKCRNIRIQSLFKLKSKVGWDGKTYLEIVASKTDHSYDGRVSYNMTNLLRGNPELSNALLDFLNENWLMVAKEFGDPLVEYGVEAVMDNLKVLLTNIPIEELVAVPLNI